MHWSSLSQIMTVRQFKKEFRSFLLDAHFQKLSKHLHCIQVYTKRSNDSSINSFLETASSSSLLENGVHLKKNSFYVTSENLAYFLPHFLLHAWKLETWCELWRVFKASKFYQSGKRSSTFALRCCSESAVGAWSLAETINSVFISYSLKFPVKKRRPDWAFFEKLRMSLSVIDNLL